MTPNEVLLDSPPAETTGLNIKLLIFHPDSNCILDSWNFLWTGPQFVIKNLLLKAI